GPAVRDDAQPRRAYPRQLPVLPDHRAQRGRLQEDHPGVRGFDHRAAGIGVPAAPRGHRAHGDGPVATCGARRAPGARSGGPPGLVRTQSRCPRQVPQGRLNMSAVKPAPAAGTEVDYDPFAGGALARVVPTTEPQREIWLADQLGRDASLAFNESVTMRLRGRLDV